MWCDVIWYLVYIHIHIRHPVYIYICIVNYLEGIFFGQKMGNEAITRFSSVAMMTLRQRVWGASQHREWHHEDASGAGLCTRAMQIRCHFNGYGSKMLKMIDTPNRWFPTIHTYNIHNRCIHYGTNVMDMIILIWVIWYHNSLSHCQMDAAHNGRWWTWTLAWKGNLETSTEYAYMSRERAPFDSPTQSLYLSVHEGNSRVLMNF